MLTKKKVVILGSTGSVGISALKVIKQHQDKLEVLALAAHSSADLLVQQAQEYDAKYVSISNISNTSKVEELTVLHTPSTQVLSGQQGLIDLAILDEADIILVAIVGIAGLEPTLAAIAANKRVALASKEVLVVGGELVMAALKNSQAELIPVDSEHSAIFQCLQSNENQALSSLTLTASGGPFRGWDKNQLAQVTLKQALNHPTWKMGQKITIDSATMFNKGLEMIEAQWLFNIEISKIDVLVHPQSIVHSMVEFIDGNSLAQLSKPSMTLPILYAFSYPQRWNNIAKEKLPLAELQQLTFEAVDEQNFSAISLARQAAEQGGTLPVVYNAANEVAVELFIQQQIGFNDITALVQAVMKQHIVKPIKDISTILEADRGARQQCIEYSQAK